MVLNHLKSIKKGPYLHELCTFLTSYFCEQRKHHRLQDHEESTSRKDEAKILSKCDYIKSEIRRSCSCQFYFLAENEQDMWNDRGHLTIHLNNDTAIYKETTGPAASDIGVIVISDTMGQSFSYLTGMFCSA